MKHPKKCDGCKAFWQSQWKCNCELGYEIATQWKGDIICASPKGACPKPRTIGELLNAPKAAVDIPKVSRYSGLFNERKAVDNG